VPSPALPSVAATLPSLPAPSTLLDPVTRPVVDTVAGAVKDVSTKPGSGDRKAPTSDKTADKKAGKDKADHRSGKKAAKAGKAHHKTHDKAAKKAAKKAGGKHGRSAHRRHGRH
jgi:hypothetical protein